MKKENSNRTLIKNKRKKDSYAACYTYNGSFSPQFIYVKLAQDVLVIDSLIEQGFIRQAVLIVDAKSNDFQDVKPN